MRAVIPFRELRMSDVEQVGGKNASLGEMISQLSAKGIRVPDGFATTSEAFRDFISASGLTEKISKRLAALDVEDVRALAIAGAEIRSWVETAKLTPALEAAVREAYANMEREAGGAIQVAVRSSATAEDLPDASFAGQQETYLNISGADNVLAAMLRVFASLYNDRAIAYRVHKNFAHDVVALSCGVQRMVRSDLGAAGVMFSLDTESGFDQVVFVTSSYGLGETVVQGAVNPDEFYAFKPNLKSGKPAILRKTLGSKAIKMVFTDKNSAGKSVVTVEVPAAQKLQFSITDAEVEELGRYAVTIEQHYGRPMDIEWGRDGNDGNLYILQARPETVKSQQTKTQTLTRYQLKGEGKLLASGRAIGQKIGTGVVRLVKSSDQMESVKPGDILVTDMTDPDWEPVMKRAAAIVTNRGGRTCHAAIIARELGVPAIVGCGDATHTLREGQTVTVNCAEGDTGKVLEGKVPFEVNEIAMDKMPPSPVKISMNVGNPELAFGFCQLPNDGVGLARLEFIINKNVAVHPKALIDYPNVAPALKAEIEKRIAGYSSAKEYFIAKVTEGVATIAAAFAPKKVIVRLSDFKSNEYASLVGGPEYEPHEENPMLGFRGASRYASAEFAECFALECEAMKRVRDVMGLTNVELMVPFVRTLTEAKAVTQTLAQHGLSRGKNGLRVVMMCEIPSNAILADQFLEFFDGFSIGSNDMTQLTLAVDRDSGGSIASTFDERDPAVKAMLSLAIKACNKAGKYVGICGQGPSDHPDLALWLMEEGIGSLSLNPDTVVETWLFLAKEKAERATVTR